VEERHAQPRELKQESCFAWVACDFPDLPRADKRARTENRWRTQDTTDTTIGGFGGRGARSRLYKRLSRRSIPRTESLPMALTE
jgi:hypothetical protein